MVSSSLFSEFQMKNVHLISKYFSSPLPLTKLLDEGSIAPPPPPPPKKKKNKKKPKKKQALLPPKLVYLQSCLGIQWLFFGVLI